MREQRAQCAQCARRVPVPADEPLIGGDLYDYADAFEIRVPEADTRPAEQFARRALGQASWPVRWTVRIAHRHLLRFAAGAPSSPDYLLGWRILTSQPDVIQLQAVSPTLGRGVLVLRRVEPCRAVLTTYLFYDRRASARLVWTITGPLHRRIVPHLMERATRYPNASWQPTQEVDA